MSDLIERLRHEARLSILIPSCDESALEAAVVDLAALAHQAAEEITTLRAENARLTEERDALMEAVAAAIECGMVPKSSAREGGAVKHTRAAQVADMLRDALAKVKGGTDAR